MSSLLTDDISLRGKPVDILASAYTRSERSVGISNTAACSIHYPDLDMALALSIKSEYSQK